MNVPSFPFRGLLPAIALLAPMLVPAECFSEIAVADTPVAAKRVEFRPPPKPSIPLLQNKEFGLPGGRFVVAITEDAILVRRCKGLGPCDAREGTPIHPPQRARPFLLRATIEGFGSGANQLALVTLAGEPGKDDGYVVLLQPPKDPEGAPNVLLRSFTGKDNARNRFTTLTRNEAGLTFTTRALLCGREVIVEEKLLDAKRGTLTTREAPDFLGAARLSVSELAATTLESPGVRHALLSPRVASTGAIGLAVDKNQATQWAPESNDRAFVSFDVAEGVTAQRFEFSLLRDKEHGLPSGSLLLATESGFHSLKLPAKADGVTHVSVGLPAAGTRCVALVFDAVKKPNERPAVTEVSLGTNLDGQSLEAIAAGLGSADSGAREVILRTAGAAAVPAVLAALPNLSDQARGVARALMDELPCETRIEFYGPALSSSDKVEEDRARDRIRNCGAASGPYLVAQAIAAGKTEDRIRYAEEAGLLAPELALNAFPRALSEAKSSEDRRVARRGLAKVNARSKGVRLFDTFLGSQRFSALPLAARVDVLRALGESAKQTSNAPAAFQLTANEAKEFRERYLLLGPAAELAADRQEAGESFVREQLKAEDHRLRARAAELAAGIPALRDVALSLVDDPAVRVREAAMLALSKANVEAPLEAKLAERVALDPWAFVRLQAAAALESGKSEPVNVRVGAAVDLEPLEKVRAAMVTALGVRRAKSQRLVVLSRATDEKEALFVRTSALVALGKMCDSQSLELLTELALGGATLQLERERRLSLAALEGLAALSPSDIATRIAPLLKEGATPDIREMARRAVKPASPSPCVR
jgi:hypothetical protein